MNELALFAGVGGGILGSQLLGWRTVCAVEKEPYCREVLLRRQRDGMLPLFPIWDDIQTFEGEPWSDVVDIISAGFPCQPFSCAGSGSAEGETSRNNLWPETMRVIREVGPRFVLLENVPNLLALDYYGKILGQLGNAGFDASWEIVSAAEIGAPHLRRRLWIVAHSNSETQHDVTFDAKVESTSEYLGNASSSDVEGHEQAQQQMLGARGWWSSEPRLDRVAHGVPNRVERLKALGNAQVPGVVKKAWLKQYPKE
jgi:DNA (cytosine-5)-methyltransferase 1